MKGRVAYRAVSAPDFPSARILCAPQEIFVGPESSAPCNAVESFVIGLGSRRANAGRARKVCDARDPRRPSGILDDGLNFIHRKSRVETITTINTSITRRSKLRLRRSGFLDFVCKLFRPHAGRCHPRFAGSNRRRAAGGRRQPFEIPRCRVFQTPTERRVMARDCWITLEIVPVKRAWSESLRAASGLYGRRCGAP
jgi:hypothetical protein